MPNDTATKRASVFSQPQAQKRAAPSQASRPSVRPEPATASGSGRPGTQQQGTAQINSRHKAAAARKPKHKPGGQAGSPEVQSEGSEDGQDEGDEGRYEYETTPVGKTKPEPKSMFNILKKKLPFWVAIGTCSLVLAWITHGVTMQWNQKGAPAPWHGQNHNSALQNPAVVSEAIADLLAGNCIRLSPSLVSCPLGLVKKFSLDGAVSYRLIYDARYLNNNLDIPKFKYETLATLSQVIEPNDWLIKTDLKSGFHHVDMAEEAWPYLGFEWEGKHYVFTQLPFGLATAPWAFTKISRELLRWWRGHGIRCTGFIDDTLFAHQSRMMLAAIRVRILRDMDNAGLIVNFVKSSDEPVQIEVYLGVIIDTVDQVMRISDGKRDILLSQITDLITTNKPLARLLSTVIGKLVSMHWSFGRLSMLMTTQMQKDLASDPNLNHHLRLSEDTLLELEFWLTSFDTYNGRSPIWRQPFRHTVFADASGQGSTTLGGWAGYFNPTIDKMVVARGHWDEFETKESSTWRELKTLLLVLQSFNRENSFDGRSVLFQTDNQGVANGIQKGTSRTEILYDLYMDIFWYCIGHDIDLRASWIPREENQLADDLSKMVDEHDWSLNPDLFMQLSIWWGPFDVDLFASFTNHQVDYYYSKYHTPDCAGVDAFSREWLGNCWCNPPFGLIPSVINYARWCSASMCLICPFWPSATWWHILLSGSAAGFFAPFVYSCYVFPNPKKVYVAGLGTSTKTRQVPNWRTMALRISFIAPYTGRVEVPMFLRGDPNSRTL